ncbi:NACHT C-terminal alpha/beta 1 domain-containing protein [Coleofasciculus sp. E2-BRE-01]|uniref:NACHT C-terminal alpha/beta 1 domain-containing protein n=1 Tax=Coleofasciculus sp. E2-BRE-01 TaxID=3069524 RepID=UPI004062DB6B
MPCPYSDTFITDLSKFEGGICIITDELFDYIPIKYFTPSQPLAVADVVEWIRAIVAINNGNTDNDSILPSKPRSLLPRLSWLLFPALRRECTLAGSASRKKQDIIASFFSQKVLA